MSQWPSNFDAIAWIVISNSLDIDFIQGDIRGRSCKKAVQWIPEMVMQNPVNNLHIRNSNKHPIDLD